MKLPDDVPTEVWETCFTSCSRETLFSLSLTCRLFRDATRQFRFKSISVMRWLKDIPDFDADWVVDNPDALDSKFRDAFKRVKGLFTDPRFSALVRSLEVTGVAFAGAVKKRKPQYANFIRAYEMVLYGLYLYLPNITLLDTIVLNELDFHKDLLESLARLPALTHLVVSHSSQLERLLFISVQLPKLRITRLKVSLSTHIRSSIKVDGLCRLLELCPDLQELEVVDHPMFSLLSNRPKLPAAACPNLHTLMCPPELVESIVSGRPIRRAEIRADFEGVDYMNAEIIMYSLKVLHANGVPLQELTLTCHPFGHVFQFVAECFPRVRKFEIFQPGEQVAPVRIGRTNVWEILSQGGYPLPPAIEHFVLGAEWSSDEQIGQRQESMLIALKAQYPALRRVSTGLDGTHWVWRHNCWEAV
ncbi:hypothetical protein CVT26_003787 [Gymnopilus dilepis]|uniref:F-box domain-containing protein n=1 Tax=Gymnopilus dilepis TaxID=231916 RepID=A0A409W1L6_9AGAR|nr:hypothetical protein CVT26_003787 [Gymnopilus dilepis]